MENKSAKKSSARSKRADIPAEADRVDKIRDLLFGEQMVGYEQRFAKLEKQLTEKIDRLSASVQAKLDALDDAAVKREKLAQELENLAKVLRQGNGDSDG
jgi:hypothetical protein